MVETIDFRAFGKNDIRGIYGEEVTEELFYYAGRGYVKFILENINKNLSQLVSRSARTDAFWDHGKPPNARTSGSRYHGYPPKISSAHSPESATFT